MKKTISICRLIVLLGVLLAMPFATVAVAVAQDQGCKPGDPNCPKPKPEEKERELDEDDC